MIVCMLYYEISKKGCGCKWKRKTIKHYTKTECTLIQIRIKEQCFYCCSIFHIHNWIFNNDHKSYPKVSVKISFLTSIIYIAVVI